MKTGPWSQDELAYLYERMAAGDSYGDVARATGRQRDRVREKCRDLGLRSSALPPNVPTYAGALALDGDQGGGLVVGCDAHAPATDWDMAERLARVGRKWLKRPRRLALIGDLFNFDVFSKFENLVPQYDLKQEIKAAQYAVELWAGTFDEIAISLGNHDWRLLKQLKGAFAEETLIDVFLALLGNEKRVRVSAYSYLDVTCQASGTWRFSHMPEYAQTGLFKAKKLANRMKDRHVCLAHQHGWAVGLDESGRYAVADLPMLGDPAKLAYVGLADSSKPAMKRGFALLRGGALTLFSDNPALTRWEDWL